VVARRVARESFRNIMIDRGKRTAPRLHGKFQILVNTVPRMTGLWQPFIRNFRTFQCYKGRIFLYSSRITVPVRAVCCRYITSGGTEIAHA
jgi:hypothetical protein